MVHSGQRYIPGNGTFRAKVHSRQWYIPGTGTLRYNSGLVGIKKLHVGIDISLISNPRLDIECVELILSHNSAIRRLLLGFLSGSAQFIRLTTLTSIKKGHVSSRSCTKCWSRYKNTLIICAPLPPPAPLPLLLISSLSPHRPSAGESWRSVYLKKRENPVLSTGHRGDADHACSFFSTGHSCACEQADIVERP